MQKAATNWLTELTTQFNSLVQNLGIEGPAVDELRNFVLNTARDQYKAGNKGGIAFALSDKGKAYFAGKA